MKKMTKREKLIYTTLISTILAILLLATVTDIYAKYTSAFSGSGNIELAKWEVKVNGKGEAENFELDIKTTNNNGTKIYPGSTGYFKVLLENNSDVPAEYTISLKENFYRSSIETDTLKIYSDNTYSDDSYIDITTKDIVGKIESNSNKEITFYWKWVDDDTQDKTIAENYSGFTISANVIGEQTEIALGEDIDCKIVTK